MLLVSLTCLPIKIVDVNVPLWPIREMSRFPPEGPIFSMSSSSSSAGEAGGRMDLRDVVGLHIPGGGAVGDRGTDDDEDDEATTRVSKKTRKEAPLTEQQLQERRERNREHAKRSRVRKRFLLESLAKSVRALQEENDKLKQHIITEMEGEGEDFLKKLKRETSTVIAEEPTQATKRLDGPDFSLVKALQTAQQNFVITDPSLPDNPIVYASEGFLTLTGYKREQVLGRNCRFLQGPETDPRAVDQIRKGIEKGEDTTVVLLNYMIDGSKFWNQFFVAPLRDGDGRIMNHLGVQCKVSQEYAEAWHIKS